MGRQLELFGAEAGRPQEPLDPHQRRRIRTEMERMLATWRAMERLPAEDGLTKATVAEILFHGLAKRLPAEEAEPLVRAFDAELDRLYDRWEDRPPAPPAAGPSARGGRRSRAKAGSRGPA